MLLPLGIAAAADCDPWHACPVAADLHPVRWDYGARYQRELARRMGGRAGSPAFGSLVAEADVRWRFFAYTGEGLPDEADDVRRWLDGAGAGAILAVNAVLDETLARAPTLETIRAVGDAIISPSIEAAGTREGKVTVEHRVGDRTQRRVEQKELEEGFLPRKPRPRFGMGIGWQFRELEAPEEAPFVTYGAWLQASHLGITSMRGELSLVYWQWTLYAAQEVWPRVSLVGSLRSKERNPAIGRWALGAQWLLPGSRRWSIRLDRITLTETEEVTWLATLRGVFETPIPGRLVPPLAPWPALEDFGPNTLRSVAVRPVD